MHCYSCRLNHRAKSGIGQNIDIALVDAQIASLVNMGTNYLLSKEDPDRVGNEHANIVPYQSSRSMMAISM